MFYVKILLNFYQNCLTLVIAKIKLYAILKNDRLKSHKKGVLFFLAGAEGLDVRFGFALRTNGSATVATQQYPPHRSSLKTVH